METTPARPTIVCLCGSTRFMDAFHAANAAESRAGKIVLTVEIAVYSGASDPQHHDPDLKARLDELHLRKIDLADEVLVLNVGGYVGPSTRREVEYARVHGKALRWLETDHIPDWVRDAAAAAEARDLEHATQLPPATVLHLCRVVERVQGLVLKWDAEATEHRDKAALASMRPGLARHRDLAEMVTRHLADLASALAPSTVTPAKAAP